MSCGLEPECLMAASTGRTPSCSRGVDLDQDCGQMPARTGTEPTNGVADLRRLIPLTNGAFSQMTPYDRYGAELLITTGPWLAASTMSWLIVKTAETSVPISIRRVCPAGTPAREAQMPQYGSRTVPLPIDALTPM